MALTNQNITLRALEPSDVELLYQWENSIDVWRVSNLRTPLSKFALANYIKTADKDIWETRELRVVIEVEGTAVGTVELFDFDPYHNRAGVGVIIYESSDRKKGIATRALELLFNYAKNELGIAQIYANVVENNIASLKLFEQLGFELSGIKKNWLRTPTGWENEHLLQKFL